MKIQRRWWTSAIVAALAALAPGAVRAQTTPTDTGRVVGTIVGVPNLTGAPRDTGLVVGSLEAAIRQPLVRSSNLSLRVDLSERMLYVMNGTEVVRRYPVSVGQEGYRTPPGAFRIRRLVWNPDWRPPRSGWARGKQPEAPGSPGNPMGRVKIFFSDPDYYIHGTGVASSLGQARSHGCLRMRNIDAVELARLVMTNGGAEKPVEWYQQTLDNRSTMREVILPKGVPIRIVQ
jgi:lipoprotein-anchoring transpeptidase ErfK/SrfK